MQIVFVIQEVEIELLAELGILAQSLVAEVGDVIEQPAIKAAYQTYLDRVSPSLLGAGAIVKCGVWSRSGGIPV